MKSRIEVVGYRENNKSDIVYKKFIGNEVEAIVYEWELRMQGYKTKIVRA